jgi:hypothetical protein
VGEDIYQPCFDKELTVRTGKQLLQPPQQKQPDQMGKGLNETLFQRRPTNGQSSHKKMLDISALGN